MGNLVFALNATIPVFVMMIIGYLLHRIGWLDDVLADKMNTFVFRIPLPVMLFGQLANVDIRSAWDGSYVLFCFTVTLAGIGIAFLVSNLLRDRTLRGEMVQASYRSSAALLGVALINNIYGSSTMAALMIVAAVPIYNIAAVIVLTVLSPDRAGSGKVTKALLMKTLKGVVTNPIIIGCLIGTAWSLLRIPLPAIPAKVVSNIGSLATPLGLMAMGATFDWNRAFGRIRPALAATFLKLLGFCTVFLPVAILLGFRTEKLIAILVMLGSATTVSCYVMARNTGHEGVLTSSVVMLTTLLSGFTLTFWIYLLRMLGFV